MPEIQISPVVLAQGAPEIQAVAGDKQAGVELGDDDKSFSGIFYSTLKQNQSGADQNQPNQATVKSEISNTAEQTPTSSTPVALKEPGVDVIAAFLESIQSASANSTEISASLPVFEAALSRQPLEQVVLNQNQILTKTAEPGLGNRAAPQVQQSKTDRPTRQKNTVGADPANLIILGTVAAVQSNPVGKETADSLTQDANLSQVAVTATGTTSAVTTQTLLDGNSVTPVFTAEQGGDNKGFLAELQVEPSVSQNGKPIEPAALQPLPEEPIASKPNSFEPVAVRSIFNSSNANGLESAGQSDQTEPGVMVMPLHANEIIPSSQGIRPGPAKGQNTLGNSVPVTGSTNTVALKSIRGQASNSKPEFNESFDGSNIPTKIAVLENQIATGNPENPIVTAKESTVNLAAVQTQHTIANNKVNTNMDNPNSIPAIPPGQSSIETPVLQETAAVPQVNKSDLFSQIIDHAKMMFNNGNSEMQVSLKPEQLGKLQLNISLENHIVTAKFVTESQQVKQIIETNLPQLRQSLQDTGIKVQQLMVSVAPQNGNQSFGQSNSQSQTPGHFSHNYSDQADAEIGQPSLADGYSSSSLIDLIA